MNQNLHRIVFNRRRGQWMAVAESACAHGKSGGGTKRRTAPRPSWIAALAAVAALGGMPEAQAQIAADRTAPKRQQPTVLAAPNGVPLVNVRTPSAAGVSRNTYRQFDVGTQGVILNNSRTATSTQLGGWVQGNPWLARGSARVLLNEVRSTDPSLLRGTVEVAGPRAEVIIANPAGIQVDGAGFLNASRLTLTTGTPIVDASGVTGWHVHDGAVQIAGAGLDARGTDYAAILARAVQINAGVWAQDLRIVAGTNDIDALHQPTATTANAGPAPSFAIDVSQLGGMYAGRIRLVGTEAGLGVRHAGQSIASGDLILQADGTLTHTGAMQAGGSITLSANELVELDGAVHAGTTLQSSGKAISLGNGASVSAAGDVVLQAGHVAGDGVLQAARGAAVAAGVLSDGRVGQTGTLSLSSSGLINFEGRGYAGGVLTAEAPRLSVRGAALDAPMLAVRSTAGDLDARDASLVASSLLDAHAMGALITDGAVLSADRFALSAATLSNLGGRIAQHGNDAFTLVTAGRIDNRGGTISVAAVDVSITADSLLNAAGRIEHGGTGTLALTAPAVDNVGGRIVGEGDVSLRSGTVRNDGVLSARRDLRVTAETALDNGGGLAVGGRHLAVDAGRLDVGQGSLHAAEGDMHINADSVIVSGGVLRAGGRLDLSANRLLQAGSTHAGTDAALSISDALSNAGTISAGKNLLINAGTVHQAGSGIAAAGRQPNGQGTGDGSLSIHALGGLDSTGVQEAAGTLLLSGASLNLANSHTEAAAIELRATAGSISTDRATVMTPGSLTVDAHGAEARLSNIGGLLQGGSVTLHAGEIDNSAGAIAANGVLAATADAVRNNAGIWESGSLSLDLGHLDNTGGRIAQSGPGLATLDIRGALIGTRGLITSHGPVALRAERLDLGSDGRIETHGDLGLRAESFQLSGTVRAEGRLHLDVGGEWVQQGTLSAGGDVVLQAGSAAMASGSQTVAGVRSDGTLAARGDLTASARTLEAHGDLLAGGAIALSAERVDLSQGRLEGASVQLRANTGPVITAGARVDTSGSLRIEAMGQALDNVGGHLSAGAVDLQAAAIDNRGGEILQTTAASQTISTTATLDNRDGRIATAANALIVQAASILNNGGRIEHSGTDSLSIHAHEIAGSQGRIFSNGVLRIDAATVGFEGAFTTAQSLVLRADQLDHQRGRMALWGNDGSLLQVGGVLDNQGGDMATTGALALQARTIDNRQGSVTSAATLTTEATESIDSDRGLLAAIGDMSLRADTVHARNARIEALDGSLTVVAQTVDQRAGRLIAARDLHGQAARWDNTGGIIEAQGSEARLAADTLLNDDGRIRSAGSLTLQGRNLVNGGLVYAGDDLSVLSTERLVLSGTLAAGGRLDINAHGLDAAADSVLASGVDDNGQRVGHGGVRIDTGSQLLRIGGRLIAAGDTTLAASAIDVQGSRIVSAGVDLRAHDGAIDLGAASIDASGNFGLMATGNVRTAGAVVVAQQLNLEAASLDNRSGSIAMRSSGPSRLRLNGTLDNRGGSIGAGGVLAIEAASLSNAGGQIVGEDALVLRFGTVDNRTGLLAARHSVDLHAVSLDNTSGTVVAIDGPLAIATDDALINESGRLHSKSDLSLSSRGLRNGIADGQAGQVVGRNVRIDTAGADLDNRSGTVAATGNLDVAAGRLMNEDGLLVAAGDAALQTTSLGNARGRVAAGGTLTLNAEPIGSAVGAGAGSPPLGIDPSAGSVDNRAGTVESAQVLRIEASGSIDNRAGAMRSAGSVSLRGATLDNRDTLSVQGGVEGVDVSLLVDSVDNGFGRIAADGNADLSSLRVLRNSNGLVVAGSSLQIGDADHAVALTNEAGDLIAGSRLSLHASSLGDAGRLTSGGAMALTLDSDWNNRSSLTVGGTLDLTIAGALTNEGQLRAAGNLSIQAATVDNRAGGEIAADNLQIRTSSLLNRGLIDGRDVLIQADSLTNIGSGRIYGDQLALQAGTLTNDTETIGSQRADAVIAARASLDIGATTVLNREHALLFSAGDMAIGGSLDLTRRAQGQASLLHNASATIEALGNLSIAATEIRNTNEHLSFGEQAGSPKQRVVHLVGGTEYDHADVAFIRHRSDGGDDETFMDYTLEKFLTDDTPLGRVDDKYLLLPSTTYPLDRFGLAGGLPAIPTATYSPAYTSENEANSTTTPEYYAPPESVPWALFGVQQPEPMPDPASPAFADWKTRNHALYLAFDARVVAFAADVAQRRVGTWTYLVFTEQRTDPVLLASDPGRIRAGGDARLDGHLLNQASQVVAGGTLLATGSIDNQAIEGIARLERDGSAVYAYGSGGDRKYRRTAYAVATEQTITVAASEVRGGASLQDNGASGVTIGAWTAPTTGQPGVAGGTGNGSTPTRPVITEVPSAGHGNGPGDAGSVRIADSVGWLGSSETRSAWPVDPNEVEAPEARARTGAGGPLPTSSAGVSRQAGAPTPADAVPIAHAAGPLQAKMVVRSVRMPLALPSGSLFSVQPTGRYLVETDPRFTDHRQWLSSDYALEQLRIDPATTLQRLGDGFYEQQLVREQIGELTGRRFLQGYADDESQYRALIDAGVRYAAAHGLRPGVALSAEQMAQLTGDIVWLVTRDVTLPDGRTQAVLVPQVYVRVREGDLRGDGTLISAERLALALDGDLVNSGTIAARDALAITADNLRNLGGRLSADTITASALRDIENIGGRMDAITSLSLAAGQDLTLQTTTRSSVSTAGTDNRFERTEVDRVATLHVSSAAGQLLLQAGRDLQLQGANVANDGSGGTVLSAGRDIDIGSVATHEADRLAWNSRNWRETTRDGVVGTTIASQGALALSAGRDITVDASTLRSADEAVSIGAGRDLTISTAQTASTLQEAHYQRNSGLFGSSTKQTWDDTAKQGVAGSTVSGHTVDLAASQDLMVSGSQVVSDAGTRLSAGRDLQLDAAAESSREEHLKKTQRSGLFGNGIGFTIGSQRLMQNNADTETRAVGTTVGATAGDVVLQAGGSYRQVGSDVLSPGGNVSVEAQQILIDEALQTRSQHSAQQFSQSGLSVSLSAPMIDAMQGFAQQAQSLGQAVDPRMKALAAANLAMAGAGVAGAAQSLASVADSASSGLRISLSLGASRSQSDTRSTSETGAASHVTAAGNISLQALGAGEASDLRIRGSEVDARGRLSLQADSDVQLEAAQHTAEQHSRNSGSSASIGVAFSMGGTQNGLSFNAGASASKGMSDGRETTNSLTHLRGADVQLASGGDLRLQGAVVAGERVQARVGGDLSIESVQDAAQFEAKQQSAGFSVSVCVPPFCYGTSSASANYSQSHAQGRYASVTEQAAIRAGDGGFDIDVAGHTGLIGGAITSSQVAVDQQRNRLSTGSLSASALRNLDQSSANGFGLSGGYSTLLGDQTSPAAQQRMTDADKKAVANAQTGFSGGAGVGSVENHTTSTTVSGISTAAVTVRDGSTDAIAKLATGVTTGQDTTAALTRGPTGSDLIDQVQNSVAITQQFGQSAANAIGGYAQDKLDDAAALRALADAEPDPGKRELLMQQAQQLQADWGEQGTLRVAAHTAVGALTGGVGGAVGAAAGTLTAPVVHQALLDAGVDPMLAQGLTALASSTAGAIAGGTAGGAAAANEVLNNYLKHQQWEQLAAELAQCKGDDACITRVNHRYTAISAQQDVALATCDTHGNCDTLIQQVADGARRQMELVAAGQLPENFAGAANLQAMGERLASNPTQRRTATQAAIAKQLCEIDPVQCITKAAVTAAAPAAMLTVLPALAAYVPALAAAAKISGGACIANIPLCISQAGAAAADILAGDALGGASLAGTVAASKLVTRTADEIALAARNAATVAKEAATAKNAGQASSIFGYVENVGAQAAIPERGTFLFRGDGRPPEVVFAEGLQPRGANRDLYRYALENEPSIFVPTSKSPTVAREFAEMQGGGYVYTIRGQANGVDVNAHLGSRSPFPSEMEIAVPDGIKPSDILGARQVSGDGKFVGPFLKNGKWVWP